MSEELGSQSAPESSSQEAPSAVESSPAATSDSPAATLPPVSPAYTPNGKYNIHDQEKHFPEWAKPLLTSKEREEEIRALFEKADGLDLVKQKRDGLQSQLQQVTESWAPVVQQYQHLTGLLQNKGDMGSLHQFMEGVGISKVDALKYAKHLLDLEENPERQQAFTSQLSLQQQLDQLRNENMSLKQNYQQTQISSREQQLQNYFGRPEVSQVAQVFNAKAGKPDAFRNLVIDQAVLMTQRTGKDVSVEEAVAETIKLLTWSGPVSSGQQTSPVGTPQQATAPLAQEEKPTLPNIRGTGTSPAKKVPKSTDDLRKLARSLG
jgi:hypothetical protein